MKKLLFSLAILTAVVGLHAQQSPLDVTFGDNGYAQFICLGYYDQINKVVINSDGSVVAGGTRLSSGSEANSDFLLVKCTEGGMPDASFGTNGIVVYDIGNGAADEMNAMLLQPDGKLLCAGKTVRNGTVCFGLARFTAAGSLDPTFGTGGEVTTIIGTSSKIYAVDLQSDGKIVVTGVTKINNVNEFVVARYNYDGTLDNSFANAGILVGNQIPTTIDSLTTVCIQPDGKILGAGNSLASDPLYSAHSIIRFNPDGSVDSSFGNNGIASRVTAGFQLVFRTMMLQSDGKIITLCNQGYSTMQAHIWKTNVDGSLDTSFGIQGKVVTRFSGSTSTGQSFVFSGAILPDDKIVLAGSYNYAIAAFAFIRLNADGVVDSSFGSNGLAFIQDCLNYSIPGIRSLAIGSDGRILAGLTYSATLGARIAQITPNGQDAGVPLPIFLKNFDVALARSSAQLNWTVSADKQELLATIIEKSLDGVNFKKIGSVSASQSEGDQIYSYLDHALSHGKNYYRIQLTTNDGESIYSEVKMVEYKNENSESNIFPNPAEMTTGFTFSLIHYEEKSVAKMVVRDILGRIVTSKHVALTKGTNLIQCAATEYSPGTYFVQILDSFGRDLSGIKRLTIN
jgi:uncharacterized delta-60 repeat protein